MPRRIRYAVEVATRLAVVVILAFLVWRGFLLALQTMDQQMTMLGWPVGVQYLAMPAGSALALVFVLHETALVVAGEQPRPDDEITLQLPAE